MGTHEAQWNDPSAGSGQGVAIQIFHDWVEIKVFASSEESGTPLHLEMHRIRSGEQAITVTVPRQPTRAGVDPNKLLIDLKTDDNTQKIKVQS